MKTNKTPKTTKPNEWEAAAAAQAEADRRAQAWLLRRELADLRAEAEKRKLAVLTPEQRAHRELTRLELKHGIGTGAEATGSLLDLATEAGDTHTRAFALLEALEAKHGLNLLDYSPALESARDAALGRLDPESVARLGEDLDVELELAEHILDEAFPTRDADDDPLTTDSGKRPRGAA